MAVSWDFMVKTMENVGRNGENHTKTTGKWWLNGIEWSTYSLVMTVA